MTNTRERLPRDACPACDLNDKPMLCAGGTAVDAHNDLHRAFHDLMRAMRDELLKRYTSAHDALKRAGVLS